MNKLVKIYDFVVWIAILITGACVGVAVDDHWDVRKQIACAFICLVLIGSQGIFWLYDSLRDRTNVVTNYLVVKDESK